MLSLRCAACARSAYTLSTVLNDIPTETSGTLGGQGSADTEPRGPYTSLTRESLEPLSSRADPNPSSEAQADFFLEHGYVKIERAFSRAKAESWTRNVWTRLGVDPKDERTWTREWTNMPCMPRSILMVVADTGQRSMRSRSSSSHPQHGVRWVISLCVHVVRYSRYLLRAVGWGGKDQCRRSDVEVGVNMRLGH